jgi:lipopolysaccharide biosynthesis glycosyltransferase
MPGDDVMGSTRAGTTAVGGCDPIVVLAADDHFAMPLAATIRSALDNLAPGRKLRIYVLDAGIKDATKERLIRSWPDGCYHVEWLRVDESALAGLPVSGHINLVSYYRILIPRVLPIDVRRAIYLDADLIVRTDLSRLWDRDLAGQLCLAAQDCAAPYLDSSQALANYRLCGSHLGSAQPVPNFRELGLKPQAAYFNAGVLLINLVAWRNADVSGQSLACLEQHRQHVLWWDQYALNVVLAGRWGQLDARWNQGSHVYMYPTWEQSPFDQPTYDQLRNGPYIVHFTTRYKPWQPLCRHPFRKEFFEYLDRTAWAGWRPPRLKAILELAKIQERRLRRGRNWLRSHARQWFQRGG